jgi:hypothetical protein
MRSTKDSDYPDPPTERRGATGVRKKAHIYLAGSGAHSGEMEI